VRANLRQGFGWRSESETGLLNTPLLCFKVIRRIRHRPEICLPNTVLSRIIPKWKEDIPCMYGGMTYTSFHKKYLSSK